jgi:hypothetical protein
VGTGGVHVVTCGWSRSPLSGDFVGSAFSGMAGKGAELVLSGLGRRPGRPRGRRGSAPASCRASAPLMLSPLRCRPPGPGRRPCRCRQASPLSR